MMSSTNETQNGTPSDLHPDQPMADNVGFEDRLQDENGEDGSHGTEGTMESARDQEVKTNAVTFGADSLVFSTEFVEEEADANKAGSGYGEPSAADESIRGSIVFTHHSPPVEAKNRRSLAKKLGQSMKKFNKEKKKRAPLLSYEVFMWTWFLVLTVLAVVDRFSWNVWPRQTYSIGRGGAGGDNLGPLRDGPWSVKAYDAIARVSGRYSILAYNFLLITRLESLEWLCTNSFINKYLLDCSNIVNANLRMHAWNGIALCVLTLLHVWSILFPCVTDRYSAVMVRGEFEWPISERKPVKCSKEDVPGCWPGDANLELKQMGLQADDVFRLVEMTVFLLILMPISIRWFARRWHAGIFLHQIINVVYFVDIVRRHTHPHSWILNTPVFCYYVFDKLVWGYHWRRNNLPEVRKIKLGDDFMVLYWYSPFGLTDEIGPDYALRLHNSSWLEGKHIFTCFENRSGAPLGDGSEDGFKWNVGVVIRIFRRKRLPQLGKKDAYSHTMRMYNEDPKLLIVGPKQGEMSDMLRNSLLVPDNKPLTLFGAGSAINFIVDCLQWCSQNEVGRTSIALVYTTRDYELFHWAKDVISALLPQCEDKGIVFDVRIAFTGLADHRSSNWFESVKDETTRVGVSASDCRVDLHHVIASGATVFCQGSAGLKNAVESVCRKQGATFYGGRGGAREDIAEQKL